MKFAKRVISLLLILAFCLGLCACSTDCDHEYRVIERKDATCSADGYTIKQCSKCDDEYRTKLSQLEHSFAPASCTAPKTCTACGITEGDPRSHTFVEKVCMICGQAEEDVECKHDYEIVETVEGSCYAVGSIHYSCKDCGDSYSVETTKKDHNFVNGKCSYCGQEAIVPPEVKDYYDGSKVTITFYHTMGAAYQQVLNTFISEFNKLYPNITIEHMPIGSYDNVRDYTLQQLVSGTAPNIVYCYADHVALYNSINGVVPLDELIASDVTITRADGTTEQFGLTAAQQADFIEGFYNEGRQFGDGNMYMLPFSKSTEVLYYNKTFFDTHGLKVPTTWNEMEQVCAQIKAIDPSSIPLGYDSEANLFITMCAQLGSEYTSATGEHYLFDNAENKEFVKMLREWYQKGYIITQEIYGNYTSSLFTATSGTRSYMSIASSAGAKHQRPAGNAFEVGIATIPQVDPANPKVISQGPSLCIMKNSNMQEVYASWLFVEFLTTNTHLQAAFADATGYLPVLKSVSEHPIYAAKLENADGFSNVHYLSAKVSLEQMDAYFTSPVFVGSAQARSEVGILLVNALTTPAPSGVDALLDELFCKTIYNCKYYSN